MLGGVRVVWDATSGKRRHCGATDEGVTSVCVDILFMYFFVPLGYGCVTPSRVP
jgi:hypothetical protein